MLQLIKPEIKLKRSEKYFWILSKFFKHTRRKQEKETNMDNAMETDEHRQLEWMCEHECNVGGKYVLPQA